MDNLANASFGKSSKTAAERFVKTNLESQIGMNKPRAIQEYEHIMQSLNKFENEQENKENEKIPIYDLGTFRIPNGIKQTNDTHYENCPPSDIDVYSNNYEQLFHT